MCKECQVLVKMGNVEAGTSHCPFVQYVFGQPQKIAPTGSDRNKNSAKLLPLPRLRFGDR